MKASSQTAEQIKELMASLPEHIQRLHARSLEQLQPWIESWLTQANLVSREEFDIQARILKHLQAEVEALKKSLA